MNTRTSFLIPFHNAAATVGDAIASALGQTVRDLEVLLVDDGSTDEGAAVVRRWMQRDGRVRLLAPGRVGLVAALNLGLSQCKGRYVARLDADDIATPQRLEWQLGALERDERLVVVDGQVEFFRDDGDVPTGMLLYAEWVNSILEPADFDRELLVESPIVHPGATFVRSSVETVGGYANGDFPEDYDLWLRLHAEGGRFRKVPNIVVRMRDRPDRLTRNDPRYGREGFRWVRRRWLQRMVLHRSRELVLWGAGREGRAWLRWLLREGQTVVAVVDVDPRKIGSVRQGVPVIAPSALPRVQAELLLVAVGARGARAQIRTALGATRPEWREGVHWWALR